MSGFVITDGVGHYLKVVNWVVLNGLAYFGIQSSLTSQFPLTGLNLWEKLEYYLWKCSCLGSGKPNARVSLHLFMSITHTWMKIASEKAYKINAKPTGRFCVPLIYLHYIPSYFFIKYPSRGRKLFARSSDSEPCSYSSKLTSYHIELFLVL